MHKPITTSTQVAEIIAEIDTVVPESDAAYNDVMRENRRDHRDQLMYMAAEGATFLLKELDKAQAELSAYRSHSSAELNAEARASGERYEALYELAEQANVVTAVMTPADGFEADWGKLIALVGRAGIRY